jgi:hypothetical protein
MIRPQSGHSAKIFLQSLELGLPHPLIPLTFGSGGGPHSLAGEELVGPNSKDGTYTTLWYSRYICTLWIRLIDGNAKSLRLKSYLEKGFAAAVYFSETSSPF